MYIAIRLREKGGHAIVLCPAWARTPAGILQTLCQRWTLLPPEAQYRARGGTLMTPPTWRTAAFLVKREIRSLLHLSTECPRECDNKKPAVRLANDA